MFCIHNNARRAELQGFAGETFFSPECCGGLFGEFEPAAFPCEADSGISPPLISDEIVASDFDESLVRKNSASEEFLLIAPESELMTADIPASEKLLLATNLTFEERSIDSRSTFYGKTFRSASMSDEGFSSKATTPSPQPKTPDRRTEEEGQKTLKQLAEEAEAAAKAKLDASVQMYIASQARLWRDNVQLMREPDLSSAMQRFFDRLEVKHGQNLVRKMLGESHCFLLTKH